MSKHKWGELFGRTPWGPANETSKIAEGIISVSTSSHGGIHLDRKRQAKVTRMIPDFKPFAGAPWYEEDCDWAVVAVVFPEHFDGASVQGACKTIRGMKDGYMRPVFDWLESPAGHTARLKADKLAGWKHHQQVVEA